MIEAEHVEQEEVESATDMMEVQEVPSTALTDSSHTPAAEEGLMPCPMSMRLKLTTFHIVSCCFIAWKCVLMRGYDGSIWFYYVIICIYFILCSILLSRQRRFCFGHGRWRRHMTSLVQSPSYRCKCQCIILVTDRCNIRVFCNSVCYSVSV